MDVDGTLTDGKIYMGNNGELFKVFDVKDGYAIRNILPKLGILPVIITGRTSKIVANRCQEIGITEVYQGEEDKLSKMCELAKTYNSLCDKNGVFQEFAYVGDDLNDLDCMLRCGFRACPADAVDDIKQQSDYICQAKGGSSIVRELIEYISLQR